MVRRFPMRTCWASRLLWPMVRGPVEAEVGDGHVRIKMGWIGNADIAIANVARLTRVRWPWWGGLGVRLGRNLVAFATGWGQVAGIELIDPIQVRAPMRWRTGRVLISVDDVDGFLDAVARERGIVPEPPA